MARDRKHRLEEVVRKLQDTEVLPKQGRSLAVVLQQIELTEPCRRIPSVRNSAVASSPLFAALLPCLRSTSASYSLRNIS
jgi:hypothetical protein